MALQPVAVMGIDGWVFTPKEKLDNLFMHYVSANKSQSNDARNLTYSYQYTLATWNNSKDKLMADLEKELNLYFGGYYSSVSSLVKVKEDPQRGGAYILEIFLEVKDEYGKTFNLAKMLSDFTSKSSKWVNMNNYGDPNQFAQ